MSQPEKRGFPAPAWLKNRKTLGRWGEEQAAATLQARGMALLHRNWRCRHGEIDLILRDGSELVFVEVKTRRTDAAGLPEEALTERKAAQLMRLANFYLAEEDPDTEWRIDLVAVECDAGGRLRRCEHLPCVVWGW